MTLRQTSLLGQRGNAFIILVNIAKLSSIGAIEFCTPIIKGAEATQLISKKVKLELRSQVQIQGCAEKAHPA